MRIGDPLPGYQTHDGLGDGIAAAGLNPKPANHSSEAVQKQTDGAIFWKTTTGRPFIASFYKNIFQEIRNNEYHFVN